MWSLLVACAAPPAPAPPVPPAAPAARAVWSLVGRATSDGLDTPPLPDGTAVLGPACATVNASLHGDGPPCLVEDWTDGPTTVRVTRAGARLRFDGAPGRTTWTPIAGILSTCLGDPLALPPARDPVGQRILDGATWLLALSGQNMCGLSGTLRLDVTRDHADWSDLSADGLPWSKGGREAAQIHVRAQLREVVRTRWSTLDPDSRDDALRALALDPHPDAKALLKAKSSKR
jgi:hypothetical protein